MRYLNRREFLAVSGSLPLLVLGTPSITKAQAEVESVQDISSFHGEYRGTASVTIGYYGVVEENCYNKDIGAGIEIPVCEPEEFGITHSNTVEKNVRIEIAPPLQGEASTEDNPFNLVVGTLGEYTDTPTPTEGNFTFFSALELMDVELGPPPVLFQYWDLDFIGEQVTGELTNTHNESGAAYNIIHAYDTYLQMVVAHWPREGTILEGIINEDNIRMQIISSVLDQANEHYIELEVERV